MFEGFSQDARRAVVRAQHEAIRARDDHIGSEHLLLGLLAEPGPAAEALTAAGLDLAQLRTRQSSGTSGRTDPLDAEALASLGIDLDAVQRATDAAFGPGALDRVSPARRGGLRATGRLRFSADAKKSLELGLRSAVSLRHSSISAGRPIISGGHLLIGIIDQAHNPALETLAGAGVDTAVLRADVLRRITAAA
jgi:ATP-dependent Clp protease ATP-binding subunit ClpA